MLTVNGNQDVAQETVNAIRVFKQLSDPPPMTTVGLSNISNSCPNEYRSLINRTFMIMLMAAGLDSAIADPLDKKLMEFIRIAENRETKTPLGKLIVALYDATAAMEDLDPGLVDRSDQDQMDFFKTVPDPEEPDHLRAFLSAHLGLPADRGSWGGDGRSLP